MKLMNIALVIGVGRGGGGGNQNLITNAIQVKNTSNVFHVLHKIFCLPIPKKEMT